MSAAEVIEEIKKLSDAEQREVIEFVLQKENDRDARIMPREKFEAILDEVLIEHETLFRKLAQ